MKKQPAKEHFKEVKKYQMLGLMAEDSEIRKLNYLNYGCNAFKHEINNPRSWPLGFWVETDIWDYIHKYNVPYSTIYDKGWDRTGCMFCMFGVHLEKEPNRFQRMHKTHRKLWEYCIYKLGLGKVMDHINVPYKAMRTLESFVEMKE